MQSINVRVFEYPTILSVNVLLFTLTFSVRCKNLSHAHWREFFHVSFKLEIFFQVLEKHKWAGRTKQDKNSRNCSTQIFKVKVKCWRKIVQYRTVIKIVNYKSIFGRDKLTIVKVVASRFTPKLNELLYNIFYKKLQQLKTSTIFHSSLCSPL